MLELEESGDIPMLEVPAKSFNLTMVCYTKKRTLESAQKVQQIFDRMVELSKKDPIKKPIGGSYLSLMLNWLKFDPERAEKVFFDWNEAHQTDKCEMRLDSNLLKLPVSAWYFSRDPRRAEKCDTWIQDAIESDIPSWKPTTRIFNMGISAWCETKTLAGAERAEQLLQQMRTLYESNPTFENRPDADTYYPMIKFWSNIGRMEKAEGLLMEYITDIGDDSTVFDTGEGSNKLYSSDRNIHKLRSKQSKLYNLVLKGWASQAAAMPEAALRAEDLLLSMNQSGIKPNGASFQYVLEAWRKRNQHFQNDTTRQPKVDEIISFLDREKKNLGGSKKMHPTLRKNWKLLEVRHQ
jgi:hypothetical protein